VLALSERKTSRLNKKNKKCEKYSTEEFIQCSREKFLENFLKTINCTIINMRELVNPSTTHLPLCSNERSAVETFSQLMSSITQTAFPSSKTGCTVPCTQTSYDYNIEYYSAKSWFHPAYPDQNTDNIFLLNFLYRRLDTEEQTEAIVYDIGNVLTAAGGNLGLFMGFSCLSIILAGIQYFATLILNCNCKSLKNKEINRE